MAITRAGTASAQSPMLRRSARLGKLPALFGSLEDPTKRITKSRSNNPTTPKRPSRLECSTCGRNLSRKSFPKALTKTCSHDVSTCKACTKTWIATQLDNVTYDNISCPECPQRMANNDIKANAIFAVYMRFDELERRGIAETVPGWRWCLAPGCSAGQVHQPLLDTDVKPAGQGPVKQESGIIKLEDSNHVCTCNKCGAKACVTCDRPYHDGQTCDEYQERRKRTLKDDKATLETIAQQCKKCPSCQRNIQKNGGCDQMRCTICHATFCWLCMRTYGEILSPQDGGHAASCIYSQPGTVDPHAPHVGINGNNAGNNGGNVVGRIAAIPGLAGLFMGQWWP